MRVEAWLFGITTIFLVLVTPAYWFITDAATTATRIRVAPAPTGPAPPRWS